jgi:hypothetical protein
VPLAELARCRVGDDGDVTVAQPSRAVLRHLSGLAARASRLLVCLHGTGNRSPRVAVKVFASQGRVAWRGPGLSQR